MFSTGCGSPQPEVSQDEFFQKHVSIKDFYFALEDAKKNEVDFFAPDGFKKASKLYEESFKLAKNDQEEKSDVVVQEGQAILSKSINSSTDAKELLKVVREVRELTLVLVVSEKYKVEFDDADKAYMKANSIIETGELQDINTYSENLIISYNNIRSKVLKDILEAMVKESASLAKENLAKVSAPKTMAIAENEFTLALDIVKQDPNKMNEAKLHARKAIHNFKKSNQITIMIKHFKEERYNEEDYILWYWAQLETINEHIGDELDFTKDNYQITDNINRATAGLIYELQSARETIKKQYALMHEESITQQKRIDELNEKFNAQVLELQLKKQKQKQKMKYKSKEEQYTFVNSLFNVKEEARIYKEGKNIVISAFGIDFPRNKSEIPREDYTILTKIISAIKQYPTASIGVYGHTDSIGEATPNMKLSIKRAKNVTNFLIEIGKIKSSKIITKGFGEKNPVATNMIKAGRRQNSRIEIHIFLTK